MHSEELCSEFVLLPMLYRNHFGFSSAAFEKAIPLSDFFLLLHQFSVWLIISKC